MGDPPSLFRKSFCSEHLSFDQGRSAPFRVDFAFWRYLPLFPTLQFHDALSANGRKGDGPSKRFKPILSLCLSTLFKRISSGFLCRHALDPDPFGGGAAQGDGSYWGFNGDGLV